MVRNIILFIFFPFLSWNQTSLGIEGAVKLCDLEAHNMETGTIRFNSTTQDFEGWNGTYWASLTGYEMGHVVDVDENIYPTIKIGSQTWMARNLRTTRYKNGVPLSFVTGDNLGDSIWQKTEFGACCRYDTADTNYSNFDQAKFGLLYNWHAVANIHGLCPEGWHIPTDQEWITLINQLGGGIEAGGKLKEIGSIHWVNPNVGAENKSGFTALPGGHRSSNGDFENLGYFGAWWTDVMINAQYSEAFLLNNVSPFYFLNQSNKQAGASVRCLKNQ